MEEKKVFILTGDWQDFKDRNVLRFFGTSDEKETVEILINNVKPVFFIDRYVSPSDLPQNSIIKPVDLKSFDGKPVDAIYFNTQKELVAAAQYLHSRNIATYESDIDPIKRYLMERFINVQASVEGEPVLKNGWIRFVNPILKPTSITPDLLVASIDIETRENNELLSIAIYLTGKEREKKIVFMIGENHKDEIDLPDGKAGYIKFYNSEKELLLNFIKWFKEEDPDIIIGWHVIGFDLMFLERKCSQLDLQFDLGRGRGRVSLRKRKGGGFFAFIPGRIVIDGPAALRTSFYSFEDYKLETVAQELLGTGKLISPLKNKIAEIERLFIEDKKKLAEYNLNDAILVTNIFEKAGLIDLSIKRAHISGLLMDQLGMMTAAFDHFYLPRLHRAGFAAPNIKDLKTSEHAAGGHVIDPKPGIYDDVVVLDFKSLYPSIIRTFKIDPLSRLFSEVDPINTPVGFKFSSANHFLPDFISELMERRNAAIKEKDKYLSQAIKILMNSFYGVMGSYGCRFYHPQLPTAITGTGQWLLLGSKDFLERLGYQVLYGDTDSLFIKLKEGEGDKANIAGEKLAAELNQFWKEKLLRDFGVESYLEIEYEKFYKKFTISFVRKGEVGAKKRYAGMLWKDGVNQFEFVGMEFVRSDWTKLAKEFQMELYERVFTNKEINNWIRSVVDKVYKGEYDDKLVYKKRLRKDIDDYTKNIPPQVRAAKMLSKSSNIVYYIITKHGPVPIELLPRDIDYKHYIEKQLKPVADSILTLLGESFDSIVNSTQLNIFDDM